jgi:hypothetical protein
MKVEWLILGLCWLTAIGVLWFIPKAMRRLALVAFLFKQALTWLTGLIVVQYGMLSYPVRLFHEINRASFSFEFMLYPMVCAVFNARFPDDSSWVMKAGYYIMYCTMITVPEVIFERYTDLIQYHTWAWYDTWFTLLITFWMSRTFCVWFFKHPYRAPA